MAQIDFDDEDTWPDDPAELAKIAETGEFPSAKEEEKEEPTAQPAKEKPEESTETKDSSEELPEEPKNTEDEVTSIDGIPVITRDGKHVIPHSVLKSEREKRQAAEAELAKLREQAPPKAETPKAEEQAAEPPGLPADVQAKADYIREQWGDDMADQYLESQELKRAIAAQAKLIEDLRSARQQDQDRVRASEEQQQRDAIDSSPALAAWESDAENSPWFSRAVQLNNTLVNMDDDYAAMTWAERFQVLPEKLKAMYPTAPMPKISPTKQEVETKAKAVFEKAEKAAKTAPASISDMEGSDIGEQKSPARELEDMTAAELAAHMEKLAMTPGGIDKFLRSLESS